MAELEQQLQSLKRQRASVKAKLTMFKNYLNGIGQLNNSLDDATVIEVEERLDKFTKLFENFDDIQTQIDSLVDDIDTEFVQREEFDNSYFSTVAIAKNLITNAVKVKTTQDDNATSASVVGSRLQGIKLPVIELPKYDGSYETWLEFRDTFQSLIHENESITDIQRYHYLRSALSGGAFQVIQSLEFTSTNYAIAWDVLCKRFNNFRLLVHNHIKALFNLEPISKESSVKIRQLIDALLKHLRALKLLKQPTDQWDTLIIYLISTKLDKVTVREWEECKADTEIPTLNNLLQFLKSRADLLETLEMNHSQQVSENKRPNSRAFVGVKDTCVGCEGDHGTRDCKEFAKLSVDERFARTQAAKLCLNCLRKGHFSRFCKAGSCRKCRGRHHTLLHREKPATNSADLSQSNQTALPLAAETPSVALSVRSSSQVILSTASVLVYDINSQPHKIRALLDCGSQSSFITTRVWQILKLKLETANLAVSGLTQLVSHSNNKCTVRVCCSRGSFISNLSCFLLPQITGDLPNLRLDATDLQIPSNITLADSEFNVPGPIDLLIGADLFWNLIGVGRIVLGKNKPILQRTRLGWIVAGPVGLNQSSNSTCNVSSNLEAQVSKFWEMEEFANTTPRSKEEIECENNFTKNTRRDEDGRFVVTIPFKHPTSLLGNSFQQAKRRFLSLEKRLQADPNLKNKYTNFISEYESLGHMSQVLENSPDSTASYYMPHHGVMREGSTTTKLRVVFDGSARSDSGYSINDLQMIGPVIQNDLLSILLRFRKHTYVASSDIEKMYRQVLVEPEQRPLQRILWRSDPKLSLGVYQLNTVTYGTASGSFLAIRCLFQLAQEYQCSLPNIAHTIKQDFFVDDLLTGAETVEELASTCKQISEVLQKGCFVLRKWISNDSHALNLVTNEQNSDGVRDLVHGDVNKTLGLSWSSKEDVLLYKINISLENQTVTKRAILSTVAQIFDPLGLLSPAVVTAKIILQKLWEEKLSWDQSVPQHVHSKWLKFRDELPMLNALRIPRHVVIKQAIRIELHGFSDASKDAYGGCVYLRSTDSHGNIFVQLLCAKSKVAPLKRSTIPRLELCGSLILARLVNKVTTSLNVRFDSTVLWCDSTVVLGWLKASPNSLKTFVANRVAEIQSLTEIKDWRHVSTKDNPADSLSRGVSPGQLNDLGMWWRGPNWLSTSESTWPEHNFSIRDLPELRQSTQSFVNIRSTALDLREYSSLNRLERIVAYCLRFLRNSLVPPELREMGPLSVKELNRSLIKLILMAQQDSFPQELMSLKRGKPVDSKSKLLGLNPFIDENGVIRVGGRLSNSEFDYDKRHPIILDGRSPLMKLIFKREHVRLLHPGPQLLLAAIRDKFWPIAGKNSARGIVRDCIRCFRVKPKVNHPLMGDLPSERITATFPFSIVGVDYAGPFFIKEKRGRASKTSKCYLSLFICFSTKAVHLELVADLTKDAFILALRRFVSRRGKPSKIYSDNGTNFVGANNELQNLGQFLKTHSKDLSESLHAEGLNWHFIPAHSPHFGGLWEAGVKSAKHHLKRVVGNASLTYDQLYTVFVQIEAILNSRPLSPMSCDPHDPLPITPAHFLIGRTLTSLPDPDVRGIAENTLTYFQRLQQMVQHFWTRWAKEYVSELQQRKKWKTATPNVKEGDLVVIKEQDQPPMKWLLGRVTRVQPGLDGVVRVVNIKTTNGELKRSVSKVCALPLDNNH